MITTITDKIGRRHEFWPTLVPGHVLEKVSQPGKPTLIKITTTDAMHRYVAYHERGTRP